MPGVVKITPLYGDPDQGTTLLGVTDDRPADEAMDRGAVGDDAQ